MKTTIESGRIPAIETHYNGFRFRSRLEARWAVFFDCMGIKYEYEPEKFQCGDVRYIPDFFLPDLDSEPARPKKQAGMFFEVKGAYPSTEEIEKLNYLHETTGKECVLFHGSPFDGTGGLYASRTYHSEVYIAQCPFCGVCEFNFTAGGGEDDTEESDRLLKSPSHCCVEECFLARAYGISSDFIDFQWPGKTMLVARPAGSPMLAVAYQAAKSARFEDSKFASEVKGLCAANRTLAQFRVWSYPEVLADVHRLALDFARDPDCPKYDEPWYVPHIAHMQTKSKEPCPCYSCVGNRRRGESA